MRHSCTLLFLTSLILLVNAALITVDDADSQWKYNPAPGNTSLGFEAISPSTPCPLCQTRPNATQALNFTWHDGIVPLTAQLSFAGVSVGIYVICPEKSGVSLTFSLDDQFDGSFVLGSFSQPACTQFTYNHLIYARTNLTLSPHDVTVSNDPALNANDSNLLLDYTVYDDGKEVLSSSPSDSSFPTSAISILSAFAGLLVGALGGLFGGRVMGGRRGKPALNPEGQSHVNDLAPPPKLILLETWIRTPAPSSTVLPYLVASSASTPPRDKGRPAPQGASQASSERSTQAERLSPYIEQAPPIYDFHQRG